MQTSEKDMKILELWGHIPSLSSEGKVVLLRTLLNGLRDEPVNMSKVQSDQEFISLIDVVIEDCKGLTKPTIAGLDRNQRDTIRLMNMKGTLYEKLAPFVLHYTFNEQDIRKKDTKSILKKSLSVARAHEVDVPPMDQDFELLGSRKVIGNICTILRCAGFLEKRVSRKRVQCWELEEETTIEHLEALIEYKMNLTFDEMKALGGSTI